MNIENLTIYSDTQLIRLQERLYNLYRKHSRNEDLRIQIVELELEMKTRGLETYDLSGKLLF